jgi:hypothetical protein
VHKESIRFLLPAAESTERRQQGVIRCDGIGGMSREVRRGGRRNEKVKAEGH